MKKILFSFSFFFLFAGWIYAQVIADFEPNLIFHSMANGTQDSLTAFSIVSNPTGSDDPLNYSRWVMKFHRNHAGDPWAGFWSNLKTPIDMTTRKYIRVDVLKYRASGFHAKVEGGTTTPSSFELPAINTQAVTDTGMWITMVFHFPNATGTYPIFDFMPDFADPVNLTKDMDVYFDNIVLCKDSLGTDSVVIENFEEILPLHSMANGSKDNETAFSVVPNPKPDPAINNSTWVLKFDRAFDGNYWAGFWVQDSFSLTTNKFVTVDVIKPDSSGTKFKFEGGPTTPPTFELWNTRGQKKVGSWDRIPYAFPNATGEYKVIAFMPDWDTTTLTHDHIIYFDNIVLQATDPTLAVSKISVGKGGLTCYPNPVQSTLVLDNLKEVDKITIYNTVGQEVLKFHNVKTGKYEINASSLQRGMYIISVIDKSGEISTAKIIKE
jgi:hypothetical protein